MISKAFKKQVFKYVMIDSDPALCHKQRGGRTGTGDRGGGSQDTAAALGK